MAFHKCQNVVTTPTDTLVTQTDTLVTPTDTLVTQTDTLVTPTDVLVMSVFNHRNDHEIAKFQNKVCIPNLE